MFLKMASFRAIWPQGWWTHRLFTISQIQCMLSLSQLKGCHWSEIDVTPQTKFLAVSVRMPFWECSLKQSPFSASKSLTEASVLGGGGLSVQTAGGGEGRRELAIVHHLILLAHHFQIQPENELKAILLESLSEEWQSKCHSSEDISSEPRKYTCTPPVAREMTENTNDFSNRTQVSDLHWQRKHLSFSD